MPTWLAIAIPSVVAFAACVMWALDYVKKGHEIDKLRLELDKLRREAEQSQREGQSKASGLYKPTAAEVDRIAGVTGDADAILIGKRVRRSGANAAGDDDDGAAPGATVAGLVIAALIIAFLLYGVIRLLIDLARLFMWLF